MKITFLGHAGLFIETRQGSILCDPWFNPAYFASWFPFPDNAHVNVSALRCPTYLYISHLHQDHFDAAFLREYVWKETIVLLPSYPLPLLERELRGCGFTKFHRLQHAQPEQLGGLTFLALVQVAPADGPIGDSGLVVDDGETRIFQQSDARPVDLDPLVSCGPFDAHFLQYSGALWYPMAYHYPEHMRRMLGRKKRHNEMERALRYIQEVNASTVFPSAGPPCFLDESLFAWNDFDRDPANIFPDQTVFLEFMQANGWHNGHLLLPGSTVEFQDHVCHVRHPFPAEVVQEIFTNKRVYLEAYQARQRSAITAKKCSWPRYQVDILSSLREWFEPLLALADRIAIGVNGRILIDCDVQQIVIDFHQRKVYAAEEAQEWEYYFHIDAALVEYCILHHIEDWVNQLFLSCRFEATRKGPYNEYVYTFFKCLSEERLLYAERYYAEATSTEQFFEHAGYRIQRRCPHLGADLKRFGSIEGETLTCTLHGWQFHLPTGRSLTSDRYHLTTQQLSSAEPPELALQAKKTKCHHCWYHPSDIPATGKQEM